MLSLHHPVRVFLHTLPTDLRNGFDGLSGLVTSAFSQDPTSGHLFLFVNRRRDRLKILYWDRDGFAIWMKNQTTGCPQLTGGTPLPPAPIIGWHALIRLADWCQDQRTSRPQGGSSCLVTPELQSPPARSDPTPSTDPLLEHSWPTGNSMLCECLRDSLPGDFRQVPLQRGWPMTGSEPKNRPPRVSEPVDLRPIQLLRSAKIRDCHLVLLAIVYVRQSTPHQVRENRESRDRQYALADLAVALGWPRDRVIVIDEDQGQSGRSAAERAGFQRLLAEVTMGHVGIILGLEMSWLARSSADWHRLLEMCALCGSLLADQDGVYDPADPNDRLLLGLKGTLSEAELLTLRNRLERGRQNKAARGELFDGVPMGYIQLPSGEVTQDLDEQVRGVVRLIFEKFEELNGLAEFRDASRHATFVRA